MKFHSLWLTLRLVPVKASARKNHSRSNSTFRCFSETLALNPACNHAMACVCPALRELSLPHHALNL